MPDGSVACRSNGEEGMTIQDILQELKIEYAESGHHHCRPGWIQIKHCPFCRSSNYHLGWNTQSNYASCWRCGSHYGPKVLEALGLPRRTKALFGRINTPPGPENRVRSQATLREPKGKGPIGRPHRQYLLGRGFSVKEISSLVNLWQVEGIGFAAKLGWRLYIPITYRSVKVSWTTRAIGNRVHQRYISASAEEEVINHKELVYGMDFCSHSIVVCEGPFDAWKIGPGAGALFGTTFTTAQVKLLVSIPRRFICFDSSPVAQRKANELACQLASFPGMTENIVIDAKDPGEASRKEIKLIRAAARL